MGIVISINTILTMRYISLKKLAAYLVHYTSRFTMSAHMSDRVPAILKVR